MVKKWKCTDCKREYVFNPENVGDNLFGDDDMILCDGCGKNWVCFRCNCLEMDENGNDKYYCKDCNGNEDMFVDDIDFDKYGSDYDEDIDVDDDLNDQHEYTTLSLFPPI